MKELYTTLKFQRGAMHLMLEVEEGYDQFLEDVYMYEEENNQDWFEKFNW
jgi:hypothetical protein